MSGGRWVRIPGAATMAEGDGRTVVVAGGLRLALFRVDGEFFAIDDTCPHQGASLGEGFLHRGQVVCPWHNWSFEVRTGRCPRVPHIAVAAYRTRRAGDDVEIEIPGES